jgi:polysaccharide deacetylase 2 family uncharacterized protein YibQ
LLLVLLKPEETVVDEQVTEEKPVKVKPAEPRKPPAAPPEYPEIEDKGSLIFVIDDVGNSLEQLENYLKIPFPITFAVMPDRKYTAESIGMIRAAGREYVLHQPMEALGGQDPGESAIYTGMTETEVIGILEHNFSQMPDAVGMNNHMGSKATSDERVMDAVMKYLGKKDLFFLDSYTISNSLGEEAAARYNVSYLKRNSMFLDNDKDRESILNALEEGKKSAGKKGHAVMIGHVMSDDLAEVLLELYPDFIEDGFSLREISEIFVEMNQPENYGD